MTTTAPTFGATTTEQPRGQCPVCGFNSALNDDGLVAYHFQIRVRTGVDGHPEEYVTRTPCDGMGEQPEEVE